MQKRKFDELISHFNRKVSEMSIDQKYKMELLGMISAIGFAHEKELGTNLAEVGRDCISRQQAIYAVSEALATGGQPIKALEQLPPIQPEPHWIPVTENCDCDLMDNEEVLVFQKDGTINGQIRHAMFYDFNGKKKFVTWEEGITIYNVLAYMPLPEPYKGVTDGRN